MGDYYNVIQKVAVNSSIVLPKDRTPKKDTTKSCYQFRSRRSPVMCCNGCVASTQPLASSIGLDVLRRGGNASDASIAMAGALAVLEPCSTGLGGDMFALHYEASSKNVTCINGSGRSPSNLTLDQVLRYNEQHPQLASTSPLCVTVPGAAKGWEDLLQTHGSGIFTMEMLLEPAIQLAEQGFPVAPVISNHWADAMKPVRFWHSQLYGNSESSPAIPFTVEETGKTPEVGQIYKNPELARVLRSLGRYGANDGFYNAFPGQAIVETLHSLGGVMEMNDLTSHTSAFPNPIHVSYRGVKLWQAPPNSQGIAGLIALKSVEALEKSKKTDMASCDSVKRYHSLIEAMRLGFHDAREHVAGDTDPDCIQWLLDDARIYERANRLYDPELATAQLYYGHGDTATGTVSFNIIDGHGNAISFVNSNYMGFGTGIVPAGCGFSLQNRGYGFSLVENVPNALEPNKRPFHTILPGLLTHEDTNELYGTLSNMGGFMQPQGHLQLTVNLVARGMDPQAAVDEARFCIADGTCQGKVLLEEGIPEETTSQLLRMGHNLLADIDGPERSIFGKAQIITRNRNTGIICAGSDGRGDGCAIGY